MKKKAKTNKQKNLDFKKHNKITELSILTKKETINDCFTYLQSIYD